VFLGPARQWLGPVASGPELVATVSEAGALGQISFVQTDPAVAKQRLDRLELSTSGPRLVFRPERVATCTPTRAIGGHQMA
jgi:NAD(P)H-dependent flavin oxidoreductase YrpB (nitropropane dioxygenase family)